MEFLLDGLITKSAVPCPVFSVKIEFQGTLPRQKLTDILY